MIKFTFVSEADS